MINPYTGYIEVEVEPLENEKALFVDSKSKLGKPRVRKWCESNKQEWLDIYHNYMQRRRQEVSRSHGSRIEDYENSVENVNDGNGIQTGEIEIEFSENGIDGDENGINGDENGIEVVENEVDGDKNGINGDYNGIRDGENLIEFNENETDDDENVIDSDEYETESLGKQISSKMPKSLEN